MYANCETTKLSMKISFKARRTENMTVTMNPLYELVTISPCPDCEFRLDCPAFQV